MDKAAVSHQPELATVLLGSKEAAIRAVVSYVETLMAEDKKSTGLKALQVRCNSLAMQQQLASLQVLQQPSEEVCNEEVPT